MSEKATKENAGEEQLDLKELVRFAQDKMAGTPEEKLKNAQLQRDIHNFGSQAKEEREQYAQMLEPKKRLTTEEIKSKINSGILREFDTHLMQRGAINPKWVRLDSVFSKQYTETGRKNISMMQKHLDNLEHNGIVSKDKNGTYTMSVSQYDGLNYFKSPAAIQDREKLAEQFAGMKTGNLLERADNWIMNSTENTLGGALKDFSNFHNAFTKSNGWGKGDPGAEALVEVVGGTLAVAASTGKVLTKATTKLGYGLAKTASKAIYGTSKGMARFATKIFAQKAIQQTTNMNRQMLSDKKQSLEQSLNSMPKAEMKKDSMQEVIDKGVQMRQTPEWKEKTEKAKVEAQQENAEKKKELSDKKKMLTAEIKKIDKQLASLTKDGHQKAKSSAQTKSAAQSKTKTNTSKSSLKAKAKEELNKPVKKEEVKNESMNKVVKQAPKPFNDRLSKIHSQYEAKSSQSRNAKNKTIEKGQETRRKLTGQDNQKQAEKAIEQAEQQAKTEQPREKSR